MIETRAGLVKWNALRGWLSLLCVASNWQIFEDSRASCGVFDYLSLFRL